MNGAPGGDADIDPDAPGGADAADPGDAGAPRRRPLWLASAAGIVVIAVVAWLSASRVAVLAAILVTVTAQIVAVVRHRTERAVLVRAAWALPIVGLLAAAFVDPRAGVLLMPAGLACLLVGLGLVHAASVRERVVPALRGRAPPEEEPETSWRRDRASLVLIVPTLALAVLLLPLATWAPGFAKFDAGGTRSRSPDGATHGSGAESDPDDDEPIPRGSADGGDGFGSGGGLRVDPTSAPGTDPWLARRVLIEATPTVGGVTTGNLGAIYLRRLASVEVDAAGRWRDDGPQARRVRDTDDGAADGWCDLLPRPAPGDTLDLAVHQVRLSHAPSGWNVLHTLEGTCSVDRPSVRHVPESVLLVPPTKDTAIDYRIVSRAPSLMPFPTDRTRAVARDPRALTLPQGLASVDALAAEAREATRGVATDLGRVRAIARHLREGFAYADLGEQSDTVAALDLFVASRGGTCEQFAEAAAFMLRSVGIPSRLAEGFLARDWDTEKQCWVARGRDSHAWVEVDFEGCGWVIFDPTPVAPPDARDGARPAPATDRRPEHEGGDETPEDEETPRSGIDGMVRSMHDVRDWFGRSMARFPWLWIAATIVSIVLLAVALRRRHERLAGRVVDVRTDRTPWGRLLVALARRGHRRRPSQTALEFAAAVAAGGDPRFARLREITARQQAARFGGRPLTAEDERAIEELARDIGARAT